MQCNHYGPLLYYTNCTQWSSIFLRVGSPPQTVRVLISTSSNQALVVLPEGCSTDDSNCANDRGGVFKSDTSTTWAPHNSTTAYVVALDPNVGLIPEVQYGSDTLALGYVGSGTPVLTSQLVGGIATTDLYTGVFGLNPLPTNFSNDSPVVASYMSNLKAQNQIPSLSYGFNAGNGYRFNTVLASLTLGGYDASLFNANNLSFTFDNDSNSDLMVNTMSITQTSSSGNSTDHSTLSSTAFSAFIDTTTPYLWLPGEVCAQFEAQFGLTYDNTSGLYLVDDALHDSLLTQDANITFTLGNATSTETVDIVLPYAAFDLIASSPLVETPTRYFPLKRADTTSQVTLGRTFFQEAYLIADYERSTFSISQMSWNPNAQAEITSILPLSTTTSSSSTSTSTSTSTPPVQKQSTVPTTTIVAATICGAIFLTLLVASIILIRQRQKKLDILIKSPPTPAPAFAFAPNINPLNSNPPNCAHCRSFTPSPEPVEADSMTSSQTSSSMENYNIRRSTPIPSGLAAAPISPMSPQETQSPPSFQNHQISPSTPGPTIPPRFSSLDRVASPTSYYRPYQVPEVQSGIYELPAREEVERTPVESLLQRALDQVVLSHNQESHPQENTPYPALSSQAQSEACSTIHDLPPPTSRIRTTVTTRPQIRIQTQTQQTQQQRRERTATWIHSPIYGSGDENWSTLNGRRGGEGGAFTFNLHPQLRTAQPHSPTQIRIQSHTQPQSQTQTTNQARDAGRGRDLIREHEARMREWEAMRGPLSLSPSTSPPPAYPPPQRPLPALPIPLPSQAASSQRERRGEGGGVVSPMSPGTTTLDPREYSWLRLP